MIKVTTGTDFSRLETRLRPTFSITGLIRSRAVCAIGCEGSSKN